MYFYIHIHREEHTICLFMKLIVCPQHLFFQPSMHVYLYLTFCRYFTGLDLDCCVSTPPLSC